MRELRVAEMDRLSLEDARFRGHAAVFNTRTAIGEPEAGAGFYEEIAPGAFDRALEEKQDVRLLVDHDPSRLLARTYSGTMELRTDGRGLVVEAELPETTVGKDVKVLLKRGDLSQMSFGFITRKHTVWEEDGIPYRRVEDVDLFDVSVVTFPAYPETDATVRAAVQDEYNRAVAIARRNAAMQRFAKYALLYEPQTGR